MGFWGNFATVLKTVGPVVLSAIPGVPPVLGGLIVHGVEVAEAIPGASGVDKKAAAVQLVNDGLAATNSILVAKGQAIIADPTTVASAVNAGIDAVVTTVNAVQQAHAKV